MLVNKILQSVQCRPKGKIWGTCVSL